MSEFAFFPPETFTLLHDPDINIHPAKDRFLHASVEDIDFLVAFPVAGVYHLIFLEAKGVIPFSNEQLRSKLVRLGALFQDRDQKLPRVIPHFALVSPRQPVRLDYADWPAWAYPDGKVKWLELPIGHHLLQVARCNSLGFEDKKAITVKSRWIKIPSGILPQKYLVPASRRTNICVILAHRLCFNPTKYVR